MQFIVQGYPAYAYTGGRAFDPALPAVVFLHGAAMDHSVWQWQSRSLAHHGYGVLAVDLPGHGRSPGRARASIEALADWIVGLLESAGLERAALVGHSMGALAAIATALAHGARVSRIALLGASIPMPVGEAFLAASRDDAPEAIEMETVWGHRRQSLLAQSPVPGISLLGASRQLTHRAAPGVQYTDLAACNAYRPDAEAIRALRVPALVIGGRSDVMTPIGAVRTLAQEIPGARFVAVDAGHSVASEAPAATLAALRDFLAAR